PRLGNFSGRRIIQYFDSSAGMVQPTRMVGASCAFATETSAPAVSSDATTIRFMMLIPWVVPDMERQGRKERKVREDVSVARMSAATSGTWPRISLRSCGLQKCLLTPPNIFVN